MLYETIERRPTGGERWCSVRGGSGGKAGKKPPASRLRDEERGRDRDPPVGRFWFLLETKGAK